MVATASVMAAADEAFPETHLDSLVLFGGKLRASNVPAYTPKCREQEPRPEDE